MSDQHSYKNYCQRLITGSRLRHAARLTFSAVCGLINLTRVIRLARNYKRRNLATFACGHSSTRDTFSSPVQNAQFSRGDVNAS